MRSGSAYSNSCRQLTNALDCCSMSLLPLAAAVKTHQIIMLMSRKAVARIGSTAGAGKAYVAPLQNGSIPRGAPFIVIMSLPTPPAPPPSPRPLSVCAFVDNQQSCQRTRVRRVQIATMLNTRAYTRIVQTHFADRSRWNWPQHSATIEQPQQQQKQQQRSIV